MSRHFRSVLQLVEESASGAGSVEGQEILIDSGSSEITLPFAEGDLHSPAAEPRPQIKSDGFAFDQVISASRRDLYSKYVGEIVESVLLGYHGTAISFSSSACRASRTDSLESREGLIHSAATQILRCLKLSGKSKSSSVSSNLVMLGSYILLLDEQARDLLFDYSLPEGAMPYSSSGAIPVVKEKDGELSGMSYHVLSSSRKLEAILKHGREKIQRICPPNIQKYHTIFSLNVEFKQFGTMNAPISGNLSFVNIADADTLGEWHKKAKMSSSISTISLLTFADVVEAHAKKVAISREEEDLYTSAIHVSPSEISTRSLLTRLLSESLGGNCKTILITHCPSKVSLGFGSKEFQTLALASKARFIENKPSKKELAEKALMSAYMKGLEEMYGQVDRKKDDTKKTKQEDRHGAGDSQEKNVYKEMLESTSEEMR